MFKNIKLASLLIASVVFLASCEKDDPEHIHDGELITTLEITVTNTADDSKVVYEFEAEHEGHEDGGHDHAGEHEAIELDSNATYTFEVRFLNESDPDNIEDITEEIIEEADEHQVFFELDGSSITVTAASDDEKDSSNNPLHIKTVWETTTAGEVDVIAYLIHEPSSKTGNTRDDFGGSVDAEVEFEAHVEDAP
jgi:hypothetical protein